MKFKEKDILSEGWINGGFFVLNKKIFKYIEDKTNCIFEREPLVKLADDKQLMAYKHSNFWYPMDTLRDKNYLNNLIIKERSMAITKISYGKNVYDKKEINAVLKTLKKSTQMGKNVDLFEKIASISQKNTL